MLWGMGTSSYRLVIIKIQSVRTNQRFEISYNITYRHNNTYRSKKKVRTRKMMKLNFEAAVDYIHEHPEIYLTADKSRASDGYICPICGSGSGMGNCGSITKAVSQIKEGKNDESI